MFLIQKNLLIAQDGFKALNCTLKSNVTIFQYNVLLVLLLAYQ